MPRFMYPMSIRKIERLLRDLEELKEGMIDAEPVAGFNRNILNDAIEDTIWALIFLYKVHRTLSTWEKIGTTGGGTVQQRLIRSKLGKKL